jgi:hypothetical protein
MKFLISVRILGKIILPTIASVLISRLLSPTVRLGETAIVHQLPPL